MHSSSIWPAKPKKMEKSIKKRTTSRQLVRFADCDPMSHLYNARYLDYFMHAREDQLRETHGFDIYQYTQSTGFAWVVVKNQISYFREARLMEEVQIQSRLIGMTDNMARVEMLMFDKERTHIKSLLWVDFIHIDINRKTVTPHGEELDRLFTPLLDPVDEDNFDARNKKLRKVSEGLESI